MSKVLVISGHPDLSHFYTNRDPRRARGGRRPRPGRRLDQRYPDGRIDVAAEQQALLDADILVLQFPLLVLGAGAAEEVIDEVMTFNFAHRPEGTSSRASCCCSPDRGRAVQESHRTLGYNHFRHPRAAQAPEQLAHHPTGMVFEPPIWSHGMVYIPGIYNTQELVEARAATTPAG